MGALFIELSLALFVLAVYVTTIKFHKTPFVFYMAKGIIASKIMFSLLLKCQKTKSSKVRPKSGGTGNC